MTAGKITLVAVLTGAILCGTTFVAYFYVLIPLVKADTVNTAVTVLNTPPVINANGEAHEEVESSTSTPTNVGTVNNPGARLAFRATATDSNNDDYFLIICKTAVMPTPGNNAPPMCDGGVSNLWAISGTTTSNVEAVAATTTAETVYWAQESNNWYGYVCDANITTPQCSVNYTNGDEVDFPNRSSPFVINHPPTFLTVANTSPTDPGQNIAWTTTATDTDRIRGTDPLTLYVCRTAAFSTSTGCTGGTWAVSTAHATGSPATTTHITIPTQDQSYSAFVYIADQSSHAATTTVQGTNSSFVVNNVAPSIDASTISVGTSTNLYLFRPAGTSGPFTVSFSVTDNNSCLNAASGNEIAIATTTIYRSGVGQNSCNAASHFDTNACYPSADSRSYITCTQDTSGGGVCGGATDATVGWTCTFELWFNADATDVGSFYAAQNWLASAQVLDDDFATSTLTEANTGNDLTSFLAFDVSQSSISYGGLQPGQQIDPLSIATTTDLRAVGNVGLDEDLYGDTMCSNWLNSPDYCDHAWGATGLAAGTSTILVANQKFATSTVSYAAATALTSSSSPTSFLIHVQKTTATTSIQSKDTLWAIRIPATITLAGSYQGVNTIIATKSNAAFW